MKFDGGTAWTMLDCWLREVREHSTPQKPLKQRDHARLPWVMGIAVEPVGARDDSERIACRTRDITESGIGILSRRRFRTWDRVRIHRIDQPGEYVDGVVVHCTQPVGGFKIGLHVN